MPLKSQIVKRRIIRGSLNHVPGGWKVHDEMRSVLQNGIGGRYIPQLARLTVIFAPKQEDGANVRNFIRNGLVDFARANPATAIYVQPLGKASPHFIGEYLNGRTVRKFLGHDTEEEMREWLEHFVTRSGRRVTVYDSKVHTQFPSIQGVWNPFTHTRTDTIISSLCDPALHTHSTAARTASDILQQMMKETANKQQPRISEKSDS